MNREKYFYSPVLATKSDRFEWNFFFLNIQHQQEENIYDEHCGEAETLMYFSIELSSNWWSLSERNSGAKKREKTFPSSERKGKINVFK